MVQNLRGLIINFISKLFYYYFTMLPFFSRLLRFPDKIALSWRNNGVQKQMTYQELLLHSQCSASRIIGALDRLKKDNVIPIPSPEVCQSPQNTCTSNGRIPLLDIGTQHFVSSMLGTWMAGMACVPLCSSHPPPQWEYFLQDSKANLAFYHSSFYNDIFPLLSRSFILLLLSIFQFWINNVVLEQEKILPLVSNSTPHIASGLDTSLLEQSMDSHALTVYTRYSDILSS